MTKFVAWSGSAVAAVGAVWAVRQSDFVVTRAWAGVLAALTVALLLLIADVIFRVSTAAPTDLVGRRRRGVKALVIGADGRASTSKVQAFLWTVAVLFAFVFLLLWGRSADCGGDDKGGCAEAADARQVFDEVVHNDLQPEYYVLLGLPLAAALAAKALTTNKVESGAVVKPPLEDESQATFAGGVAQVVGNDSGEGDFHDFQYFAFNLLALAYFLVEFLNQPANGLPDIPPTLLALAGVSTATYTTKKALDTGFRPAINAVVPGRLALDPAATLTLVGTGFGSAPPAGETVPAVLLEGMPLDTTSWSDRRIVATLGDQAVAVLGTEDQPDAAELVVTDTCGQSSEPRSVELYVP